MSDMQLIGSRTVALKWRSVPASLPPGKESHWFSPLVWLALSDGKVVEGKCLHRIKGAEYDAPVHDWFIKEDGVSGQLDKRVSVIAWMPFAVPDHPMALTHQSATHQQRQDGGEG